MAAAEHNTWDGSGDEAPRRPSTEDLGGDEKQDDLENPPDDVEHPTAAGWNQKVKQIAAIARVASSCKFELRFNAGAPYLARVAAPGSNITVATFDVTDEGPGITTIEWEADTFPPHELSPTGLTVFSDSSARCEGHLEEITNGVRVRTFTNGTAADLTCTFAVN
jgi:hypothetical protein